MFETAARLMRQTMGHAEQGPQLPRPLAVLFLAAAVPLFVLVNLVTLMFGVMMLFIARDGVTFRFLRLPGGVPAIAVMLPALIAYAAWHKTVTTGIAPVLLAGFGTVAAAVALIGVAVLLARR